MAAGGPVSQPAQQEGRGGQGQQPPGVAAGAARGQVPQPVLPQASQRVGSGGGEPLTHSSCGFSLPEVLAVHEAKSFDYRVRHTK